LVSLGHFYDKISRLSFFKNINKRFEIYD